MTPLIMKLAALGEIHIAANFMIDECGAGAVYYGG